MHETYHTAGAAQVHCSATPYKTARAGETPAPTRETKGIGARRYRFSASSVFSAFSTSSLVLSGPKE